MWLLQSGNAKQNDRMAKRTLFVALTAASLSALIFGMSAAKADALSEMASFSVFDKIDLAQHSEADVKAAHGPPMSSPRFLSNQSCYVVPRTPATEVETLRQWNPTRHRELKVFLHTDLPSSPG